MNWTQDKGRARAWTLDADTSYAVEYWNPGSYVVYHEGKRLDEAGTREDAQAIAERAYRDAHPEPGQEARAELFRQQVIPDLAVVADGSAVVLEMSERGRVVRRMALSDIPEFFSAIELARIANIEHHAEAERQRREALFVAERNRRASS